jgi:hypothetical protein
MNKKIHIRAIEHMNIKSHFKMTKKEKIGCLVLLGILIGYGAYQAAYGTTEGSYQSGFSQGKAGYACSNYQSDCDNGLNNCSPGYNGVTNQTSCLDGFVNGWKQWCNSDLTTCAKYVLSVPYGNGTRTVSDSIGNALEPI